MDCSKAKPVAFGGHFHCRMNLQDRCAALSWQGGAGMLGPSVLTWVTCTGAILGLLGASPVVARRAATGSVSSGVWENFLPPAPQQRREGRLWADWEQLVLDSLHVCPRGSGAAPQPGESHAVPAWPAGPQCTVPGLGKGSVAEGSRQHSPSSLCTGDTPLWSCLFVCKLSGCTGRDLANMGLHNAMCTESHIRARAN